MITLRIIPEDKKRLSDFTTKYSGIDFTSKNGITPCKISFSGKKTRADIKNLRKELQSRLTFLQQNKDLKLRYPQDTQYDITDYLHKTMKYLSHLDGYHKEEKYINIYPHFMTKINKIDIHFIYVKPNNPTDKRVVPLLMLHGWPSSIIEFYNIIPLLTTRRKKIDFIFEVIAPSLPGFGFSGVPEKQDEKLTCESIGDILIKLMKKLKWDRFYVHCDDWSSLVAAMMTIKYPENILGVHYALCQVKHWLSLSEYLLETIKRRRALEKESIQLGHKYDKAFPSASINTLLLSLMNSPVSLIAYHLDKLFNGTRNPHCVSTFKYGCSTFVSNILMHCPTNNISKSLEAYYRYHKFTCRIDLVIKYQKFTYRMDLFLMKTFTAVTLILPKKLRTIEEKVKEQNQSFFFLYKCTSRFPAFEDDIEFARAILDHFKKH